MNINRIFLLACFLISLISFSGCKEDNLTEITGLNLSRALSPTDLAVTVVNKTSIQLVWTAIGNSKYYRAEVFETADFSGTAFQVADSISSSSLPDTLSGFAGETTYYVRVKALGDGKDDSKWSSATFTTQPEQILSTVTTAKVAANTVTLNWPAGEAATSIVLSPGNIIHNVNATEVSAGEATITGLTPKTAYTAKIYNNTVLRGSNTFTTFGSVVFLGTGGDLASAITNAADGVKIVLQGSVYSTDNAVNVPPAVSVTILGEGTAKPVIAFNGFTLGATSGTIRFENVDLTGYQYTNGVATAVKRNYIFNQSAANVTNEITFENCTIRNFTNTPIRIQGSNVITFDKVTVNNCLVYDIGDNGTNGSYAFINTNVSTGKVNNISITNSTFYKIGYGLILHSGANSTSVIVDNNTFYNVVGNTRYLIDYSTTRTIGTFSFKNNIIGKTLSPAATANGVRYSGSNLAVSNSYKTSDAAFVAGAISGIKDYSGASSVLFTDPDNGNFLIKDDSFAGKSSAGDPRWRK